MDKVLLFCLPHAGGNASVFLKWKPLLNTRIELRSIELAGRGRRFCDPHYNDIHEAALDVFNIIKHEIIKHSYALFGHSMSTIILYELMNIIIKNEYPEPLQVIMSGRYPPHINLGKCLHMLPDTHFIQEVSKLDGFGPEIVDCPELLEVIILILKSDYQLVEQYQFKQSYDLHWNTKLIAFHGLLDNEVQVGHMKEWAQYTRGDFNLKVFNGGHFFINDCLQEVVEQINGIVTN